MAPNISRYEHRCELSPNTLPIMDATSKTRREEADAADVLKARTHRQGPWASQGLVHGTLSILVNIGNSLCTHAAGPASR